MFGFLKNKLELFAPASGKVMDLAKVPDEVFASKLAGDGIAIEPDEDIIVAPAEGELILIFKTNHAFCIRLDDGIEILVHIGIDTVHLNGDGFERLIEVGTRVKTGDPILKINRKFIIDRGYSLISPVLITNMEIVKEINCITNKSVKSGKDAVISYKLK